LVSWRIRCAGAAFAAASRSRSTSRFAARTTATARSAAKHSGTFGLTPARVPREQFRLLSGEELLRVYVPDQGTAVKVFCSVCGSSLFGGRWPQGDEISIRLGSLDDDPQIRPQFHTYVASRAAWDELPDDGLPRYDAGKPGDP
jgi:hypothetical protein